MQVTIQPMAHLDEGIGVSKSMWLEIVYTTMVSDSVKSTILDVKGHDCMVKEN